MGLITAVLPIISSPLVEANERPRDDLATVLIVDDHVLARRDLRAMLLTSPLVSVVGEAGNGFEACALTSVLLPKVVLMDYRMPGMNGLAATRAIKADHPAVSIIMMTTQSESAVVIEALRAGSSGHLLKDCSAELLVHSILAVAHGAVLVDVSLFRPVARPGTEGGDRRRAGQPRAGFPGLATERLTSREAAILQLIAQGMTNRAIGDTLSFAEVTIKKHVQELIVRLSAADRTHAAIIALRLGLID
jgi:DNA-binding NarL/FixJ family response regulator